MLAAGCFLRAKARARAFHLTCTDITVCLFVLCVAQVRALEQVQRNLRDGVALADLGALDQATKEAEAQGLHGATLHKAQELTREVRCGRLVFGSTVAICTLATVHVLTLCLTLYFRVLLLVPTVARVGRPRGSCVPSAGHPPAEAAPR